MDFRLKEIVIGYVGRGNGGFNPCSNGLSAQRGQSTKYSYLPIQVSILVLMDFRLKG